MKDLSTEYMGLKLKNPIIAASSGLTGTLDGIQSMERNGAGAVITKSIFEEEILQEVKEQVKEAENDPMIYSELSETLDYIDLHIREDNLGKYLDLIREAKKTVSIPVIGSINCVSGEDWIHFTKKMEDAGADALELNIFLNPADFKNKEFEKAYFKIITKVLATTQIPVAIKISIGVAAFPEHDKELAGVMRKADAALYTSKRLGKNRSSIYAADTVA